MSRLIIPIQPLILTIAGSKPTIPTPATILPSDDRFDVTSNIMVGQLAYNVVDDIWYYRSSTLIKPLSGGEVAVNDVEVWRSDKLYSAGNTYVSYVNPQSSNSQFQTSAIYRCVVTTLTGESPETSVSKWEFQGVTIDLSTISAIDVLYDNTDSGLTADNVKTAIDELSSQVAGASSTGANVGTGEGVYKQNAGTVLQFKSILGAGKITVNTVGDDIEIEADGEVNLASNAGDVGDGAGVFKEKSGENLVFKRLRAGTDIAISESANSLSVSANVPLKSVTNLGTGSAIFSNIVSNAARLRTLLAGTNVAISITRDDEIQISCTAQNNTASNVGTGSGIFLQKVAQDLQFKSLIAGSNISISSQANTLTISSPANVHNVSNVGGGTELFKQIVANSAQFKTLSAGTGISINASGDAIVISSNGGIPTGTEGNVLYHDGTEWIVLEIGTNGQLLTSNGNIPAWNDAPISLPSGTQGDILYNNGTDWVVLNAGTAGYALTTNGPGANPTWEAEVAPPVTSVNGFIGDISLDLNDISDVDITTPSNGEVLTWNGTEWVNGATSGGLASIAEPTNAAIRAVVDYENGNDIFNSASGVLYEYNETESSVDDNNIYLKPNDNIGNGRWVKKQTFSIQGDDYVTPQQFGAVGNGSTDDSAAFQAMFDSLSLINPKKVFIPAKKYRVNSDIILPKIADNASRLVIEGYGADLLTSQDISIFKRLPVDQSEASIIVGGAFIIKGITFKGPTYANSKAIHLGASYGSSISDCRFWGFGTALRLEFALMTEISNCLFSNSEVRNIDINYGSSWGGSTSNSQSNSTTIRNVRINAKAGSSSCVYIEACSGIHLDNVICEGGNPIDNIVFNGRGSTVVKEFSCRGLHLENSPSDSHIKLQSISGGTYTFKNIFTQYSATLINNLGSAGVNIIVEDVPWLPTNTKFNGSAGWVFKNSGVLKTVTTNGVYWIDGIAKGLFIGAEGITTGDATFAAYFNGFDNFKTVIGRNVRYDSAVISPEISDLRVGKNGALPVTITFPYTVNSADILKFEATYDRELDSYFTLIGIKI